MTDEVAPERGPVDGGCDFPPQPTAKPAVITRGKTQRRQTRQKERISNRPNRVSHLNAASALTHGNAGSAGCPISRRDVGAFSREGSNSASPYPNSQNETTPVTNRQESASELRSTCRVPHLIAQLRWALSRGAQPPYCVHFLYKSPRLTQSFRFPSMA